MVRVRRGGVALAVISLSATATLLVQGSVALADPTTTTTSSTSTTTTTTTVPVTTTSTVPSTTTTTIVRKKKPPELPVFHAGPALQEGDQGSAVATLQTRLDALHYWVGNVTGYFGDSTVEAIYALQKVANIPVDGVDGPTTQRALWRGVEPTPRPATGDLVEVNLTKDLLMIMVNGKLRTTLNTSTGGGYTYQDQGTTSVAITPTGVFHVYREVDGLVTDTLGQLWMPKYFYSGFAIHGDSFVPGTPVSHGCVRISNEAIDWIWASGQLPIGEEVWVYT